MNEITRYERLEQRQPRRRGAPAGTGGAKGPVALAVRGLLALCVISALCGGAAATEPAARPVASPAPAQASVPALKREYLRCDHVSSQRRLTLEASIYCGTVSEELMRREFDGDLDLMLAWRRAARQASIPE
ncbi:MAG: hypothetical protein K8R60_01865 [Burkholderiales bacterium]|nr:hypothetical protein [Burkholderiales bacterium]